jgi:hypothetical protein
MVLAETVRESPPSSATHGTARRVHGKTILLTIIALMAMLALFLFMILHG